MIEIYGKPACPHCDAAKRLCEMRQLPFKYYQLDTDFTREEVLELFPGARTFPQIKVQGVAIGFSTVIVVSFSSTKRATISSPAVVFSVTVSVALYGVSINIIVCVLCRCSLFLLNMCLAYRSHQY